MLPLAKCTWGQKPSRLQASRLDDCEFSKGVEGAYFQGLIRRTLLEISTFKGKKNDNEAKVTN